MSHFFSPEQLRQAEYQARFLSSLESNSLKKFINAYTNYMKLYLYIEKKKSQGEDLNTNIAQNGDTMQDINEEESPTDPMEELKDLYEELQECIEELNFDLKSIKQKDTFVKQMDDQFIQERDQKVLKQIEEAEIKVQSLMQILKSEEEKKRNKLEYDALAEKILEFGDKRKLEKELQEAIQLKESELERGRLLDAENEKRNKQYQHLSQVILQLEKELGN